VSAAATVRRTPAASRRAPSTGVLARTEWRLFCREPVGLVWGLVLPVAAFVVLGLVPGTTRPARSLGGVSAVATYEPVVLLFSLTMLAVNAMPVVLGTYRERGVLRRLAVTPMPAWRLLAVQMGIHAAVAAVTAAVVAVLGAAAFGVGVPGSVGGWVLAYALTTAALLGLGVLAAAVAPSARVANALGAALFFPLMFFAGLWIPRAVMPDALRSVSDLTPLGAAVRALSAADGGHLSGSALAVLATYALVLPAVAARSFRWE